LHAPLNQNLSDSPSFRIFTVMHSRRTLAWSILALIIAIEGTVLLLRNNDGSNTAITITSQGGATAAQFASLNSSSTASNASSTEPAATETSTVHIAEVPTSDAKTTAAPAQTAASAEIKTAPVQQSTTASPQKVAARIINPYPFPPQTFETIDSQTRAALVNILCLPKGESSVHPISGSGVLIDARGVILTNAHVAQYVLLSEAKGINLECSIRTGSPARPAWKAAVLYMPMVWVRDHVNDLNSGGNVAGTGEHDYALLAIGSVDGTPLPSQFPSLPVDTRNGIGFSNDTVLIGGYPAEFLGGVAAENSLYSLTSNTSIQQLLTFGPGSVDLMSFKGVIEAQSGSSGGPVVNPWGRLIGIIVTTSDAATADARDLRAITLSYINKDMQTQTNLSLSQFLEGNLAQKVAAFNASDAETMLELYLARIKATQ
jgi:S1-C subfamily serine protease